MDSLDKQINGVEYFHENEEELNILCLPSYITSIVFCEYFDESVDCLPNSVTSIVFGNDFNKSVDKLPNSVTSIVFKNNFNQTVDKLPDSVTSITFGFYFNKSVDKLPNSLTSIKFGECFNQTLSKLPNSVISIVFGDILNKSVDKLPNSVTNITFGYSFNKSVDKLPNSVTDITFGDCFNKSLKHLSRFIKTVCFNNVKNEHIYNNINVCVKKIIHNNSEKKINHHFGLTSIKSSTIKKLPTIKVKTIAKRNKHYLHFLHLPIGLNYVYLVKASVNSFAQLLIGRPLHFQALTLVFKELKPLQLERKNRQQHSPKKKVLSVFQVRKAMYGKVPLKST